MQRQFFSGNSIEQAVMAAARHHGIEPERLAYNLRDKKHGFVNMRRRVVIEVDPNQPGLSDEELADRRASKSAKPAPAAPAPVQRAEEPAVPEVRDEVPVRARNRWSQEDEDDATPSDLQSDLQSDAGHADDDDHDDTTGVDELDDDFDDELDDDEDDDEADDEGDDEGDDAVHVQQDEAGGEGVGDGETPSRRGAGAGRFVGHHEGHHESRDDRGERAAGGKSETDRASKGRGGRGDAKRGDKAGDRRGDQSSARPADKPADRPAEKRADRHGDKPSEKPSEKHRERRGGQRGDEREDRVREDRVREDRVREDRVREDRVRDDVQVIDHRAEALAWEDEVELDGVSRELAAFEFAIEKVLDVMDLEIEYAIVEGETFKIEFSGEDSDFLTEDDGKVLKALEHVLPRIVRGLVGESLNCKVDCDGFRASHEDELVEMAQEAADEVRDTGAAKTLSQMNPSDRRIIHLALVDDPDVETISEGRGYLKRVRIQPRDDD